MAYQNELSHNRTREEPAIHRAYEEHQRRRMEQIMADPALRREYERHMAQRQRQRRVRRFRAGLVAVVSAGAGVAAAFALHAAIL